MASHASAEYVLLDVRQPGEYTGSHIPGSVLVPLPQLAERIGELSEAKPTIVYCAIGGRSSIAARFLASRGFKEVYNLKGGIQAWNGHKVAGPSDTHLPYLETYDTLERLLALAYRMESGLKDFYLELASRVDSARVKKLLAELAQLEEQHESQVAELAKRMGVSPSALEDELDSPVAEGGLDLPAFVSDNAALLESASGALELAIMIEAHSLDLYLRCAAAVADPDARGMLGAIAEEEKAHLARLAAQLEQEA